MTPASPSRGKRGPVAVAVALLVIAVAVPHDWWTGDIPAGDERDLVLGAWMLRAALVALAAFLLLAPRFESAAAVPESRSTRGRALFAIVMVVAVALRFHRLGAPLWFDEIETVLHSVRPPIDESLRTFRTDNDHPLYSLLAAICTRTLGESAWSIRLPAALFGAGSVAATYVFARERLGLRTALVAASIVAISSHHVWFSQNARGYTGLLFFTMASSHFLLRSLEHGGRRNWVLHGLTLAACVTVHLTGVFTAVGHVAVLAWAAWRGGGERGPRVVDGGVRAGVLGLAFATLLGFAAYALELPQILRFFLVRPDRVAVEADWTSPLWFLSETARSFGMAPWQGALALVVGGSVGLVGLVICWRRAPAPVLLLLVPGVAVAAAMLGLGRNLWPRLFFFLSGFAVLVAVTGAFGVTSLMLRRMQPKLREAGVARAQTIVGLALVAAFAVTTPRAFSLPKQDYGAALRYVDERISGRERVATIGVMTSFVYREYYDAGYHDVFSLEDLDEVLPEGANGYAIYGFPVFVESRHPELWAAVMERGVEVARFRGSVGGGDVVVLHFGASD